MWTDPIVEEVRATRRQLLKESGGDIDALLTQARRAQQGHSSRVVPNGERAAPNTAAKAKRVPRRRISVGA